MLFKETKCPNCGAYHDPTLKQCPGCHNDNELFALNRLPKRVLFLHPIAQIAVFLIGFAYVGMLFGQLFFGIITVFTPWPEEIKSLVIVSLTYFVMLCGLLVVPLLTRRKLFISKYNNVTDYVYGVAYAVTIVAVGTIIASIIELFYKGGTNVNQTAAESIIINYPIIAFVVLGFIGPICEEFTYRIGLYSFLRRINKYLAFAITVIVFAFIHFDFTAENMIDELVSLPSYLACGFILTQAYEHRGPACSMTAHITYNLFACITVLLKKYGQ